MAHRKTEKIGLLIDVLNWMIPFLDVLSTNNDLKQMIEQNLDWILDLTKTHGKVVLRKAFTNFSNPNVPEWLPFLLISKGIELVYTPDVKRRSNHSDKKLDPMDDMMMAKEIIELPYKNPQITTIFCVTGDGDFFVPVSAYRSNARRAMVISTNGTSEILKAYCDGFWQVPIEASDADANKGLLTQIEELLSGGRELSRDSLLDALRKDEAYKSQPDWLNKQLTSYLNQGVLRYQEKSSNGHHVRILRLNNAQPIRY